MRSESDSVYSNRCPDICPPGHLPFRTAAPLGHVPPGQTPPPSVTLHAHIIIRFEIVIHIVLRNSYLFYFILQHTNRLWKQCCGMSMSSSVVGSGSCAPRFHRRHWRRSDSLWQSSARTSGGAVTSSEASTCSVGRSRQVIIACLILAWTFTASHAATLSAWLCPAVS